jgi:hypothetical protein
LQTIKGDQKMAKTDPNAKRPDPKIAQQALEEAKARRAEIDNVTNNAPREINGKEGPDPARYGDWENKGIASDF